MSGNFTIAYETAAKPRNAAFRLMKEEVLGKAYRLNVIFTTPARIKKWNRIYSGKNAATDILSFPISKSAGEIYICVSEAKKEAKKFGRPLANFLPFLFIHGLVHLKGYDHGATMERIETKIRRKFRI